MNLDYETPESYFRDYFVNVKLQEWKCRMNQKAGLQYMNERQFIIEIMNTPTSIDNIHQSIYRSHHILEYVKELLDKNTPADVVRALISALEAFPNIDEYTIEE